jgi:hypothetical protein
MLAAKVKPQVPGEPERKALDAEASLRTLVLSWMQFLSASFAGSKCGSLAGPAQALKDARAG